jgi:hypothetical protein
MTAPLVVPRCDAPKAFQPSNGAFDLVAFTVHNLVVLCRVSLALLWWDHRPNSTAPKFLAGNTIAIPSIADELLRAVLRPSHPNAFDPPSIKEWPEADHLVPLPTCEVESKGFSLPLTLKVHLGTEPTSRAPQGFVLLTTLCSRSVMMCPDNR